MPHAEALAPALLERVLSKLGLSEPPSPTLEGLRTLYPAWCRKVPFDNIRQLMHRRSHDPSPMPGGDATEFFEAWLVYGTGGTCWSGNGALHALLLSLGFEAARGLCTMLVAPDIPPNHGSVLVVYEGSHYVVNASILHSEPLCLDPDAPSVIGHPAWGVQCDKRDGQWYIRWRSMFSAEGLDCRFEALSVPRDTFRERYEAARAWGPFNYELHFRLIRGEAIVGAARGERVEFDRSGACVRTPLADAERRRFLIEDLGIHEAIVQRLPADTPTPPPPWSRTAQSTQR